MCEGVAITRGLGLGNLPHGYCCVVLAAKETTGKTQRPAPMWKASLKDQRSKLVHQGATQSLIKDKTMDVPHTNTTSFDPDLKHHCLAYFPPEIFLFVAHLGLSCSVVRKYVTQHTVYISHFHSVTFHQITLHSTDMYKTAHRMLSSE